MDNNNMELVNKDNPIEKEMPEGYEYEEVIVPRSNPVISEKDEVVEKGEKSSKVKTFIEKDTHSAFNELKEYMASKGIKIYLNDAGRTIENQQKTFDYYKKSRGEEYAKNYVAQPHESEHHTGLAIDIGIDLESVQNLKSPVVKKYIRKLVKPMLYKYVHSQVWKFGLIVRYTRDKEFITGVKKEDWHLRYVGKENAEQISKNNLSLEEYVAYQKYSDSCVADGRRPMRLDDFVTKYDQMKYIEHLKSMDNNPDGM